MKTRFIYIVLGVLFFVSTNVFGQTDDGMRVGKLTTSIIVKQNEQLQKVFSLKSTSDCNLLPLNGIDGSFESCESVAGESSPNYNIVCGGWENGDGSADTWLPNWNALYVGFNDNVPVSPDGGVMAGAISYPTNYINNTVPNNNVPESFHKSITNLVIGSTYHLKFYQAPGTKLQSSLPLTYTRWKVGFGDETQFSPDMQIANIPQWTEVDLVFTASASTQTLTFTANIGELSPNSTYEHVYSLIDGIELSTAPVNCEDSCDYEITDINLGQCINYRNTDSKSQQTSTDPFCVGEAYCYGYNDTDGGNYNDNSFLWTFYDTDGTTVLHTDTIAFPVYAFPNEGSHNVTLTITYPNGCTAEYTEAITIEDCDPCDTVAILVDESGSLSDQEILDIKTGLSRFIEDQLDSGLNISIIGMSDSDTDIRTDHITKQKVTTATKFQFDQWITGYGNRNGNPGISGSSDYWASALSAVNNADYIPDLVVIITDGSQTADINYLQAQINQIRQNSNLYVYGIDNEYYVNSDTINARLSRDQDPNYTTLDTSRSSNFNSTASREVVSSIRTSLDYLFGLDEPISGQQNLIAADYYGYDDFSGISGAYGTELGILSNLFAQSAISCTATIDECYACYSFQPEPGKTYWLSGWVKVDLNTQVKSYTDLNFIDAGGNPVTAAPSIKLNYIDAADIEIILTSPNPSIFYPSGNIIDGWQRIAGKFEIPANTVTLDVELINSSPNIPVYFDDIRIHPINGSMKSFVYDPITYRLMAELDENNYSTYYEYDKEGGLIRVKKETSKGIKTIQETRSGTVINNSN